MPNNRPREYPGWQILHCYRSGDRSAQNPVSERYRLHRGPHEAWPDHPRQRAPGRVVACVAVAHDGRQTVCMLLRREGETVTELLTRLDLAIAKASTEGTRTDEVNPISRSASNTSPKNKCPLPDFRILVDTSEPKWINRSIGGWKNGRLQRRRRCRLVLRVAEPSLGARGIFGSPHREGERQLLAGVSDGRRNG